MWWCCKNLVLQTVLPHCREEIKWEQPRFKNNHNYKKNNNAEINDNNNDKEADNNYKEDDNNIKKADNNNKANNDNNKANNDNNKANSDNNNNKEATKYYPIANLKRRDNIETSACQVITILYIYTAILDMIDNLNSVKLNLKHARVVKTTRPTTTRATTTTTRRTTTRKTTTRLTTTRQTTTRRTTTSRPSSVAVGRSDGRVQCFVCGSLFSTDAPDCPQFNRQVCKIIFGHHPLCHVQDPNQQKVCDVGEACLYYSWRKSDRKATFLLFLLIPLFHPGRQQ